MSVFALDLGRRVGWCASETAGGSHLFDQRDYGHLSYAFSRWLSDMLVTHKPRVLAVELPPAGLKGHASLILNGMFWDAQRLAVIHEIGRRSIDPQSLKLWSTGDRRADKDAMAAAARTLGYEPSDDNHADAACLHKWTSVATAEDAAA
jgi:hypothetical protein